MALHGIPCDHCYQPAKGLVVFDKVRYVVHEDGKFPPCSGPNPEHALPLNFRFPMMGPVHGPKRKQGRPKQEARSS